MTRDGRRYSVSGWNHVGAGRIIDVAGRKGFSVSYNGSGRGLAFRQWQVQTSGNKKAYTFTFSAGASEFARQEPAFRKILASIRVPGEPDADAFDLSGLTSQPEVLAGVLGGLVGGSVAGIWLVRRAARKKKALAEATAQAGLSLTDVPLAPPPLDTATPRPLADRSDEPFVTFSCPCGEKIKVPRSLSGKKGKCPTCRTILQIP